MSSHLSPAEQFDTLGYVVFRGLLTPKEVAFYKAKMQQASGLTDKDFDAKHARRGWWTFSDGVSQKRDWWPLIFNKRLVSAVRDVLGPTARYTQHSDLHVHHGVVGWHRDSADRQFGVGPDWDENKEKYKIARIGIYLQSYAESGSALGIVPKSHRKEFRLAMHELTLHNKIKNILKRPDLLLPLVTVRPVWIKTEPGDCVIFNQRILHSGSHIHGPKYSIFLSYGTESDHARNHRRYYLYERKDLKYADFDSELKNQLADAGLLLDMQKAEREVLPV